MSEPIRVLQVFAQMNRGGAETMIMNLYRNIDRSKVQFDFIVHTNEKCAFDEEIESLGGKIYRIPRYKGKNHFQYKKAWNKFFDSHPEYKVIHGHVRSTASIYLRIAKKYGLTTIAHSHSTSSGEGLSAIVKNILQYPIRHTADYLFACSISAGEWLFGKKACSNRNFFILKNAIDVNKFTFDECTRERKRREFGIDDQFVIGHVGRFNAVKNHEFLIDIFKEVHDKDKNSLLMLVGDGELRNSIKEKIKKLNLNENVVLTGVREDVSELLQAFDIFVFPSLYEGLGIVVIEAQASGLPCIVSDRIPEDALVTGSVEKISLNATIDTWKKSILKYKSNSERQNTCDIIKSNGYDIVETANWLQEFYIIKT